MSETAEFCYKVTDFWHPNDEIGIPWDDSTIGIKWPIDDGCTPLIAEEDKYYGDFKDLQI